MASTLVEIGVGAAAVIGAGAGCTALAITAFRQPVPINLTIDTQSSGLGRTKLSPASIQPGALPSTFETKSGALPPTSESKPNVPTPEVKQAVPGISISGLPKSVNQSTLPIVVNNGPDHDNIDHKNTLGFATELWIGKPGVRSVNSAAEEGPSAWSTTHADVQKVFESKGSSYWGAPEGGFVLYTGAGYTLNFNDVHGNPVTVKLDPQENHTYYTLVKGIVRDGTTPKDLNTQIEISGYNPGYTMGTRLPQGQIVSQDYVMQNIDAAHGGRGNTKSCGADGCKIVTFVMIDSNTGALTIIEQTGLNGPIRLVASNINTK